MLQNAYLFVTLPLDIVRSRTMWLGNQPQAVSILFTTAIVAKSVILILESISKSHNYNWDKNNAGRSPEETSGFLSLIFLTWLLPVMGRGYRHPLATEDLYPLDKQLCSKSLLAKTQAEGSNWDYGKFYFGPRRQEILALSIGPRKANIRGTNIYKIACLMQWSYSFTQKTRSSGADLDRLQDIEIGTFSTRSSPALLDSLNLCSALSNQSSYFLRAEHRRAGQVDRSCLDRGIRPCLPGDCGMQDPMFGKKSNRRQALTGHLTDMHIVVLAFYLPMSLDNEMLPDCYDLRQDFGVANGRSS